MKPTKNSDPLMTLFVETDQTRAAFQRFDEFIENAFDGSIYLSLPILGPSGSGKTSLVNQWVKQRLQAAQESGTSFRPFVFEVPPNLTLRSLAGALLTALKDPAPLSGVEASLSERVVKHFQRESYDLIVFDEIQRLVSVDANRVDTKAADWLTSLQNKQLAPLMFVGEMRMAKIFRGFDEGRQVHLERRTDGHFHVKPYDWRNDDSREAFRLYLNMLDKNLGFPERSRLADIKVALAIHHFSMGRVGLAARLVKRARRIAVQNGLDRVTFAALADAAEIMRPLGLPGWVNPFRVTDLQPLNLPDHVLDSVPIGTRRGRHRSKSYDIIMEDI